MITWTRNFLSEEDYNFLSNESKKIFKREADTLMDASNKDYVDDPRYKFFKHLDEETEKECKEIIRELTEKTDNNSLLIHTIEPNSKIGKIITKSFKEYQPTLMMFYYFTPGSSIGWHCDENFNEGATIYLNDWKEEWGGLYKYNDGEIKTIIPERNLMVYQTEHTPHCVTKTTNIAPIRHSIQLFFA